MSTEASLTSDKKLCACGCKQFIPRINSLGIEATYKHGHNASGSKNRNWKGGRKKDQGYWHILRPHHPLATNGYVFEHRLVMEEYLGRYLDSSECVHHINGIRTDNRLENLRLFSSHSEHMRLEKTGSHLSDEAKRKVGLFNKGKLVSIETRKKISEGHRIRREMRNYVV